MIFELNLSEKLSFYNKSFIFLLSHTKNVTLTKKTFISFTQHPQIIASLLQTKDKTKVTRRKYVQAHIYTRINQKKCTGKHVTQSTRKKIEQLKIPA